MVGVSEANGEVFLLPKNPIGAVVFANAIRINSAEQTRIKGREPLLYFSHPPQFVFVI